MEDVARVNAAVSTLIAALCGNITSSVRMVTLMPSEGAWVVDVVFDAPPNSGDLEALGDIQDALEGMTGKPDEFEVRWMHTSEELTVPPLPARLVRLRHGEQ